MLDNNYFATMMLATGQVDALVGGATVLASSALRPLFQIIPRLENVATASSLLILDWDEQKVGIDGSLFLADCGVIPRAHRGAARRHRDRHRHDRPPSDQ